MFGIKSNNKIIIIQSFSLMTFNLIHSIFSSIHHFINFVKICVEHVQARVDISNLMPIILSSMFWIQSQIWVNIHTSWGIEGWSWLPWTCSSRNCRCLSSSSSYSSGLPSCQTPFTCKIFNFLIVFFTN